MSAKNKTASSIYREYKKTFKDLVTIYCQARTNNPFNAYPELVRAIHRAGTAADIWHRVAYAIAKQRDFQGG